MYQSGELLPGQVVYDKVQYAMNLTIGIVTAAALLDSINPCAISVLLLTIGFLLSLGKQRLEVLKIGMVYIGALYLTYLSIGLGVLQALTFFGFPNVLAKVGALVLAATAIINLLGALIPSFPIRLKISHRSHKIMAKYINQGSIPAAFVLGILVGLFEFPCTGGPYLSILSLLHDRATLFSGILYLLYYNIVFVSPLIIILLSANSPFVVQKLDIARKKYTRILDVLSSLLMLILSFIILLSA